MKYFFIILSLVSFVSCGAEQYAQQMAETVITGITGMTEETTEGMDFIVRPSYDNVQGIWGTWNEDSNFEFFDIMEDIVVHGEIAPNGDILFLNVSSFHFHGDMAHALFNHTLNSEGNIEEIFIDMFFAPILDINGDVMRIAFGADDRVLYLSYLGQDPTAIDEAIGVPFFDNYTAYEIIERLLWAFVISEGLQ
ncbi:MAG: hypothetical protein FWE02_06030 [Defluviitaleaceae bacterium]|nr:hypothetical protein [Defluviitaleaceae bacterium]